MIYSADSRRRGELRAYCRHLTSKLKSWSASTGLFFIFFLIDLHVIPVSLHSSWWIYFKLKEKKSHFSHFKRLCITSVDGYSTFWTRTWFDSNVLYNKHKPSPGKAARLLSRGRMPWAGMPLFPAHCWRSACIPPVSLTSRFVALKGKRWWLSNKPRTRCSSLLCSRDETSIYLASSKDKGFWQIFIEIDH